MISIQLVNKVGSFAENKDIAREIRLMEIIPSLDKKQEVILDFKGIESATQSFVHALISDLIRTYGISILDVLKFKNCNETVQKIIGIVVDYMQQGD